MKTQHEKRRDSIILISLGSISVVLLALAIFGVIPFRGTLIISKVLTVASALFIASVFFHYGIQMWKKS